MERSPYELEGWDADGAGDGEGGEAPSAPWLRASARAFAASRIAFFVGTGSYQRREMTMVPSR